MFLITTLISKASPTNKLHFAEKTNRNKKRRQPPVLSGGNYYLRVHRKQYRRTPSTDDQAATTAKKGRYNLSIQHTYRNETATSNDPTTTVARDRE